MNERERVSVTLTLEDGTTYRGWSFGAVVPAAGEVVFNTAMTGYPENLTDPTYKGQILCLTYPLVGNYGAPGRNAAGDPGSGTDSAKMHAAALIVSDYSFEFSHWNAIGSLDEWMRKYNVPGVFGIDTRALTKRIREKGTLLGKVEPEGMTTGFFDRDRANLVAEVSIPGKKVYGTGRYRIMLVDCGVKFSIIQSLLRRDATVIRVPWDYDFTAEEYDGLLLSNGPGDPKMCRTTIDHLRRVLGGERPILGISLGNLLLALAAGADTYKLRYGHRSHNQPVQMAGTDRVFITSQNHGYAVNNNTLPAGWEPLFINVNDNTNEGIRHRDRPFMGVQFLPDASGGPADTGFIFDLFLENIAKYAGA